MSNSPRKIEKNRKKPQHGIRFAVVGLGHIAQVAILPGFQTAKNSELVSIISGDEVKREELRKKFRLKKVYSYEQYEEALANVDAVYIALPNHLHCEYAVRAAEAGVHILCEKPMSPNAGECQEMIESANRHGVKLMIGYRLHFEAGNLEAVRLANNGKLGDVRFFSSDFAQQVAADNVRVSEPESRGGGPLYDMGVYCINAARYLFRSEPIEVMAMTANKGDKRFRKTEEMASAILRFPGERIAAFTCSFGANDISRYTLIGTQGKVVANPAYEYAEGIKLEVTIGGKTKPREFPKRDQFAAEIDYFSDCILHNQEPEPDGWEGLADVRIVEAIHQSAQSGERVAIFELPRQKRPSAKQEIHKPPHGKPPTVRVKFRVHEFRECAAEVVRGPGLFLSG